MKDYRPLAELPREERERFCRRVLDSLSDLVEGAAADELVERVEELMGDETGYRSLCETLAETIDLARECGERSESSVDEQSFRDCVERVRERLERGDPE